VLAGLATDICVQMTAADAFLRGFEGVWVPSDCTAAETPQAKAASLKYMREVLKCDVRSSRVGGTGSTGKTGSARGGASKRPQ
jgi:nicotinamidase-related amidase